MKGGRNALHSDDGLNLSGGVLGLWQGLEKHPRPFSATASTPCLVARVPYASVQVATLA